MLKKVGVAFLFCLISTIANAQNDTTFSSQKVVLCDNAKKVVSALMEKWGELPVWTAKDGQDETRYLLLVNPNTQSWTLLQFNSEVACILGLGEASNLIGRDKSSI